MNRLVWVAFGFIVLSGITGCGSKGKSSIQDGDTIYLEEIRLANEIADAIEKNADPAKIEEINKRYIENGDKMGALPQEEQYRLNKKYSEGLGKAGMRLAEVSINHPGIQIGKIKMPNFKDMKSKMAGKDFGKDAGTDAGRK